MNEKETAEVKETNAFMRAPESKKFLTVIGVYCGIIANLLISTSNATVLPAAAAEIGGMDIYGLAQSISSVLSVALMPVFGFIAARNPHLKRILCTIGLAGGACVLLVRAIATNMMMIVVANVFWGMVSAAVFGVGFTIIRDVYDRKKAGFYLGLVGTVMSAATLIGPVLAGLVIDSLGWRAWTWICVAVLVVGALVTFFGVSVKKEEVADMAAAGNKFDGFGAVCVMIAFAALIIGLSMGTSYVRFGTPLNTALLVIAIVFLILLAINIKKKGNDAIIPIETLKNHNVLVLTAANFLHNFGAMTIIFFIAGFIMRTLIDDPICAALGPATAAGLASALMAVLGLVLGPIFGKVITKAGTAKTVMTIGNAVRVVVMACFVFFLVPGVPVWVIYVLMFAAGIFNSQQQVTQSAAPQIMLTAKERTIGNSTIQLGQNLGAGIGMAVFTLILAVDPAGGMRLCMVVALIAWIILFFITFLLKKPASEEAEA